MDRCTLRALLHQQQFRLTREREELLQLFTETKRMLTPQELHAHALASGVKVGLTTVYRLLEVLTKVQLATPFLVDGSIYYTFCSGHHHHHFICLKCHNVENIYECPVFKELPADCKVMYHKVDLFGECNLCSV